MNKHALSGCRPKPLASYLKALGILRLVAEQKDSQVKGWWHRDSFVIDTSLSRDELRVFFCEEYAPTSIVAPWNGGSGFYLGDSVEGIDAIAASTHSRFASYREVISEVRSWPEIPNFDIVEDVLLMLREAIEGMKSGRKKEELEGLLASIESDHPPLRYAGTKNIKHITLNEVETLSKQGDNPSKDEWKRWWSVIKKARTQCNTIMRNKYKKNILPLCRARLPESSMQWLDAVYTLQAEGKSSFNPVLGTGGNEGRLELSNNFMQRLAALFVNGDIEQTRKLFSSAAFNTVLPGLIKAKIGQYDPGRAGGYNQGAEIETKDFKINPWNFILTLEGTLVLAGAVVRRNPTDERSHFTTPFTVRFSSVGFSSSTHSETGRQELWLPVWSNPATYAEIKHLFGEGRSAIGRRVARNGIEFSRAVGTLGVDRGIDAFERYAFLERRGQSYVALPTGRINVGFKPELELLNELDTVTSSAWRFFRTLKNPPATFLSARQKIEEAIFTCCLKTDPYNFSELMRAIGNLDKIFALRDRSKKPALERPLFGLSPRWIGHCDDGSVEVRIAAALASIQSTGNVGPIRSNMAGVEPLAPWSWATGKGERFWFGNSLVERLSGILSRRLMDAKRKSAPCMPIQAELPVSPHDVMLFLWGECDDAKIEELLWGFSTLDWRKTGTKAVRKQWKTPLADHPLSRTWCILKVLHSPQKIQDITLKIEPRINHFLMAGRIKDACDAAIHRLHVSGLNPFTVMYEDELDPVRLLASLLIPTKDQWKLESLVLEKKPTIT